MELVGSLKITIQKILQLFHVPQEMVPSFFLEQWLHIITHNDQLNVLK